MNCHYESASLASPEENFVFPFPLAEGGDYMAAVYRTMNGQIHPFSHHCSEVVLGWCGECGGLCLSLEAMLVVPSFSIAACTSPAGKKMRF